MKKIVVTGANGQLGSELQQLASLYPGYHFLFTDSSLLPIHDEDAVYAWFEINRPDFCINCAAYTAVDKAETEPDKAMQVNGYGAGLLAAACTAFGTTLLHVSTDYVFDGTAQLPIDEDAPLNPLGVYGASKLKGEELVQLYAPSSLIIRTSWVYSSYGNNFVKTMLRLMAQKKELNVVNDQHGSPTYAADLAKALVEMIVQIDENPGKIYCGIYHYANEGAITWFEFAQKIADMSGSKCVVHPIPSSGYPTPAKRPAYSVFSKEKIKQVFGLPIYNWEHSLQTCLLQIQQYLAK